MKRGNANMILKATAKRRKRKAEIEADKQRKLIKEREHEEFKQTESMLASKNIKIGDIGNIVRQNEDMQQFIRSKGLIDENGNIKT